MDYLPDSVIPQPLPQDRDQISEWNVYLPVGQDRDKYIQNCFQTNTVSLTNSNDEVVHRVNIGYELQFVVFPADKTKLGSKVVCVTLPYSGKLSVVGVYDTSTQYVDNKEHQYRFVKVTPAGLAEVVIDGAGRISISVDGEQDLGTMSVSVTNKNKQGKLNVFVAGETTVYCTGAVVVQSDKSVDVVTPLLRVGKQDQQPLLLGDDTVSLLEELLTQLSSESAGPYPLLGNSKYAELKNKLEQLKSQISFTQ